MGVVVYLRPSERLSATQTVAALRIHSQRLDTLRFELIEFAATFQADPGLADFVRAYTARSICLMSEALAQLNEGAYEIRRRAKNDAAEAESAISWRSE